LAERLADWPHLTLLRDWHHVAQKGREFASRLCQGREAKRLFLRRLLRRVWVGNVIGAVRCLHR
jgi:hypothetical protein